MRHRRHAAGLDPRRMIGPGLITDDVWTDQHLGPEDVFENRRRSPLRRHSSPDGDSVASHLRAKQSPGLGERRLNIAFEQWFSREAAKSASSTPR